MEILLIEEMIKDHGHHFRWVPTTEMLSDCLTKRGRQEGRLIQVLKGDPYCLVETHDPEVLALMEWVLYIRTHMCTCLDFDVLWNSVLDP